MFEKLEIWERGKDYVIIYIVFRNLDTDLYHVQQANFLHYGTSFDEIRKAMASHQLDITDLFKEKSPAERSRGFVSAKEAVERHKAEFADMLSE